MFPAGWIRWLPASMKKRTQRDCNQTVATRRKSMAHDLIRVLANDLSRTGLTAPRDGWNAMATEHLAHGVV